MSNASGRQIEKPDIAEHGAPKDEQPQLRHERLFMQLIAFTGCTDTAPLVEALRDRRIEAVLYEDINDPRGVALLTFHREPDHLVDRIRPMLLEEPFASLTRRPELTLLGRTYSMGYEPDLDEALFERPRRHVLNPDWPWAIWYPLRRGGAFEQLSADEQRRILMEHGRIGMAYGAADYAHDVRLACHGLTAEDNDFIIGLMGRELHPLSKLIQSMRSTTQTSQYLEKLGPFFVGRAVYQSPLG